MKINRLSTLQTSNTLPNLLNQSLKNYVMALVLLSSLYLLSGCGYYHKELMRGEQWVLAETGNYKKPYTWKQNMEMPFHSKNPQDYILDDGWAIAIPGQRGFDLYISPYAPNKYFRSRQDPWSEVICPYSGHPLILGKRGVVAQKAIPADEK
jgi:hypothetical protein